MNKHLFHEEIGGGYGMRRKTIIDTSEIEPGKFETMAIIEATGDELDSATANNIQDAERDFQAMIQRHAGPLQAAFYGAAMVPGERYTLVFLGDFGFPVDLRITFHEAHLTTYAQFDDAVDVIFLPQGKRKLRRMYLYDKSFLVYSGWRTLDAKMAFNMEKHDGCTTMISRYGSFDEHFIDDVKASWPDYIAAYEHHRHHEEPAAEIVEREAEPQGPYELLPGLNVVFDAEGADGPAVDLDESEFAKLYAIDGEQIESMEERLAWALKRAAIASVSHLIDDDGGTCNFDSPAFDFSACGMRKAEAERVINDIGLRCFDWKPFKNHRGDDGKIIKAPTYLVISGFQSGQGYRHTHMAEAFCRSMNADGFETQMYYQMD